ncbi:hypothetical protein ACROYT_G006653 [Oculina patagonica]
MFRGNLASGSEDNIQDALSLFKELEEQNILGADRLDEMKELLNGVEEWSLLAKVEKFESKRKEYNDLLEQIIRALEGLNDLERLIAMCRGKISEESEGHIQDVRSLFKELENQNNLGIHRLDILKGILNETEKSDLLEELQEFEKRRKHENEFKRRKAQAAALASSLGNKLTGVLSIKTVFRVVASGITVVSTLEVLSRWSTFDQLVTAVNSCVLPAGTSLVQLTDGCVCLTVRAETLSALTTLWKLYQDGTLETRLYDFFVTDEVRERAGGKEVEVNVTIEEQEYEKACLELISKAQAQETEDLGRPGYRRRSNSDSNLYCKARDGQIGEGKGEPESCREDKAKYLDSEKEAFVQSYLQNIHDETQSMVTETSDSGIRTHGAPSDFDEMEDVSDNFQTFRLRDLSGKVISQLKARLKADEVALRLIYQSFGIRGHFHPSKDIFELFPDTPVKLLKDVLEALQLYDLVELLPEKPQKARSLRLALSLQEIEKLRKTADGRPTTYHSSAAVLIIADKENSNAEGIKNFFKGLNSKSDVTIIDCEKASRTEHEMKKMELLDLSVGHGRNWRRRQMQSEEIQENKEELHKEIQKKQEEAQKEIDNIKTAASAVIDRWIHSQGNFSLFAVFVYSKWHFNSLLESVTERLVAGIPDEVKFIIGPAVSTIVPKTATKTLLITTHFTDEAFQNLILEILNKRWRTLDLISMMRELHRSHSLTIAERYSSLPRLKKEEDLTD